jgi:tetratricopeptide (TPR) repeat protein
MRRIILTLVTSAALFACVQPAIAADELFDTKAASAHLEKGIADIKEKKYDAAISELEESASINPDAEAYYYLGYTYYMKGKKGDAESRKKAMECFEKAYELNPRFTPSRFKPPEAEEATKPEGREPGPPAAVTAPSTTAEPAQPQPDQQTSGKDTAPQPAP